MKPTEKEFFDDVLAILTLPETPIDVLILGDEDTVEPHWFLKRFINLFREEFGFVTDIAVTDCIFMVGRHITVTLCTEITITKEEARFNYDYEIHLGSWRPEIHWPGNEPFAKDRVSYHLRKRLQEYLGM